MKKIGVSGFLELANEIPVIDVRSPSEFSCGHIPGASNIPLFDDDERAIVGTLYKKEGRIAAIKEGLKLSGKSLHLKLEKAREYAKDGRLLVHCWRGGMRSEAMSWLFSLGDIECLVLEGGYKSYRNHIINAFREVKNLVVLGGMTGSSKTYILHQLSAWGNQVVDLENLASHKGSAFGSLGQASQPTTEQFSNNLFRKLSELNPEEPIWIEDESRNIGSVFMPEELYLNMQKSLTVIIKMSIQTRMPRLLSEYAGFPPEQLKSSVMKISKRLGGDNVREAIEAIERGDLEKAITITLLYYDKAYEYSIRRKSGAKPIFTETETDDVETNALKVLKAAGL